MPRTAATASLSGAPEGVNSLDHSTTQPGLPGSWRSRIVAVYCATGSGPYSIE